MKVRKLKSEGEETQSKNEKTIPEDRSLKFAGIRIFKLKIDFKQLKTDIRL